MRSIEELHAERAAAGLNYQNALGEFRRAWIRLAAIDRTLANANVIGNESPVPSWHFARSNLNEAARSFQHVEFAPRILTQQWADDALAVSDQQIAGFFK